MTRCLIAIAIITTVCVFTEAEVRDAERDRECRTLGCDAGDERPTHGRCGGICTGRGCNHDYDGVF